MLLHNAVVEKRLLAHRANARCPARRCSAACGLTRAEAAAGGVTEAKHVEAVEMEGSQHAELGEVRVAVLFRSNRIVKLELNGHFWLATTLAMMGDALVQLAIASIESNWSEVAVTKDNFSEKLEEVEAALQDCSFVSFDCEMTGLFRSSGADSMAWYYEDFPERYAKLVQSAEAFAISQLGLSCFKWRDGRYEARTFNFVVFPRAFEDWEPRFLSEASSLVFLAEHAFDFNKWVREGISCMPLSVRDRKLRQLQVEEARGNGRGSRSRMTTTKPEDSQFVADAVRTVTEWLAHADGGAMLDLEAPTSFHRALLYQELHEPQFGCADPPGFYLTREQNGRHVTLRLHRASSTEVAAWKVHQKQERLAAIHAATGVSVLMQLLRASKRPVVGHNMAFDLVYMLAAFVGKLPGSWPEFKTLCGFWFPGGMFDTKHLALQRKAWFPEGTALGEAYTAVTKEAGQKVILEALEKQRGIEVAGIVETRHAPGFDRYASDEVERFAHEAGYDAFMTGCLFAALLGLESIRPAVPEACSALEQEEPSLAALEPYRSRVNLMRSGHGYMTVQGDDPRHFQDRVLMLSGLADTRPGAIQALFQKAGVPEARFQLRPGDDGVAAVEIPESVVAAACTPDASDDKAAKAPEAVLERLKALTAGPCTKVWTYSEFWSHQRSTGAAPSTQDLRKQPKRIRQSSPEAKDGTAKAAVPPGKPREGEGRQCSVM